MRLNYSKIPEDVFNRLLPLFEEDLEDIIINEQDAQERVYASNMMLARYRTGLRKTRGDQ